jgi:hypothetical protein
MTAESSIGTEFLAFLEQIPDRNAHIHIFTDSDADGMPAATILLLALKRAGYANTTIEVRLKFETAWSPSAVERLRITAPDALIITDLGSRSDPILSNVPTLLLDHHSPLGTPPGATLITAYREMGPGRMHARYRPPVSWLTAVLRLFFPVDTNDISGLQPYLYCRTWVTRRRLRSSDWLRSFMVQEPSATSLLC